jgi:[protein-PII] uridylyltransferase
VSGNDDLERYLGELVHPRAAFPLEESSVLASVRGYLRTMRDQLARRHRRGESGRQVNSMHTDLMDRLTRRLVELAEAEYFAEGHRDTDRISVAAVGGYARREMSIHSDVDLLVLHTGVLSPYLTRIAERLQYWLWDAGLTVGCATRSILETLELARSDPTVATTILDTRYLAGDPVLFHAFAEEVGKELAKGGADFVNEWIDGLRERHARYGDSLYLLQPNLREGVGGLRDYHAVVWGVRSAYAGRGGLEDLLRFGLLTESELEAYESALDFLWRVRNELHLRSKRKNDRMSFEHQEQIAEALGYASDGAPEDVLPVERFMGDYYRRARAIQNHSQAVLEQCQARVRGSGTAASNIQGVEDGFQIVDGRLVVPHPSRLRERPIRLLLAFAVAQDHDVELSRSAQRMIRENLSLVDDDLRRSPEVSATLLRILDSERRVMRTLMRMNELGLLGRLLPEWEHVVCRWQHVIYHTYTVDVHSVFLVEELRRLWKGKYERSLPELTDLVRTVEDRPALFLGCLLHDIGKGRGGDHSSRGAALARTCLDRLGLPRERADRVVFLVQHHLLMAHLAQRRDLSDPGLIYEFARTVGDAVNLGNLYLLTFADVRASSPGAWTEWKGELLRELFERTAEFVETGGDDPSKALEQVEVQVEIRQKEARDDLRCLGVAESKIDAFFHSMPRRYFLSHPSPQIVRHGLVIVGFKPERTVSVAVREMRGDFSELIVCTPDVRGLYASVAGTLTARGINILASHVYTTRAGLALEMYRVTTPSGGQEERDLAWREFEQTLRRVLTQEIRVDELLRRRRRPVGAPPSPSRHPPSVSISNSESHFYTIIDISANDRLGLLYDLTRTLTEHALGIYISKASTLLDQVTDTFYVKAKRGKKLTDAKRIERLRQDLLVAAQGEEGADGA